MNNIVFPPTETEKNLAEMSHRISVLETKLSHVMADQPPYQAITLPVCNGCTQPEYCRGNAECHYTGSPMTNPDGTIRTDFMARPRSEQITEENRIMRSVYLTPAMDTHLRDIAHRKNRTKSEIIREAVADWLTKHNGE